MSDNKVSILFTGRNGMLFTDENGIEYNLHTERDGDTLVLSREKIKAVDSNHTLDYKEREEIVSKILKFMSGIKWRVE